MLPVKQIVSIEPLRLPAPKVLQPVRFGSLSLVGERAERYPYRRPRSIASLLLRLVLSGLQRCA
jgi:hypothetical protein